MSAVLLAFLFIAWAEQVSPIATVVKFETIPSLTDRLITGMSQEFPCPSIFICARNCFGGVACPAFSFSETNQICHLFKSDFRLLPGNRLPVDIGITAFVKTGLCPDNYIIVEGVCLRRSSSRKPYGEAQVSCSEDGGELVQVKTRYLMDEILKFMAADGFVEKIFYVGATDTAEEGTWSWKDGTPVSEWCKNEPNDKRSLRTVWSFESTMEVPVSTISRVASHTRTFVKYRRFSRRKRSHVLFQNDIRIKVRKNESVVLC